MATGRGFWHLSAYGLESRAPHEGDYSISPYLLVLTARGTFICVSIVTVFPTYFLRNCRMPVTSCSLCMATQVLFSGLDKSNNPDIHTNASLFCVGAYHGCRFNCTVPRRGVFDLLLRDGVQAGVFCVSIVGLVSHSLSDNVIYGMCGTCCSGLQRERWLPFRHAPLLDFSHWLLFCRC